ncbi:MAG: FkbM family methyltransferase [Chitinophagales bacterium]|nr:FkbM family methyltransferase [Chitinophagales bacterium]
MSLFRRIINKIRHIISNNNNNNASYPYIFKEEKYKVKFNINNSTEEFRLKNWGGEKEYVEKILNEIQENDVLFDIGSSVGLISVLAAKRLTKGKVVSFEPDPENAMRLKENYRINELTNFSIQQLAVGETTGKMELYTAGSNAFSPSLEKVNGIDTSIEVDIESIDNLLKKNKIPFPTVIKIDIEGAEMIALQGMKKLLIGDNRPRVVFIELHPDFLPSFNTSIDEIMKFLSTFNYTIAESINRDKQILCKLIRN